VALQDSVSIQGGYGQSIDDWQDGDDRVFTGVVSSIPNGLTPTDPNLSAAYFTLKLNPDVPDASAILQKRITTFLGTAGQITPDGYGNNTALLIHVYSEDYEGLVSPGTSYWWDFRVITAGGTTWTIATGQVVFQQQVTQTNEAGTPAALPNFGQPRFRGFTAINPQFHTGSVGLFNVGDIYFNSNPSSGQPVGWQCTQPGSPGAWQAFYTGGLGVPVTGIIPPVSWTWGTQPPTSGLFAVGSIVWNLLPYAGGNIGWVYTTNGTWEPWGDVSLP
jgi:hypothetical protein